MLTALTSAASPAGLHVFARVTLRGVPMSFGRPLGQCCRYCRQHCTGLALRTPGSPLRCLRARKPVDPYRVTPCRSSSRLRARSARRAAPHRRIGRRARRAAPHGAERAGRAAAEREPSAMLPAVSAALAERSRGGAARFASTPRTERSARIAFAASKSSNSPIMEHGTHGAVRRERAGEFVSHSPW